MNKSMTIKVLGMQTEWFIRRHPQPWKCGWRRVRYNNTWYELVFDKGKYFIDLRKPLN